MNSFRQLADMLLPVARDAGQAIIEIRKRGVNAELKSDGSPVTAADKAAEKIVITGLKATAPDITIVSEENSASHSINAPDRFFLVDPLDGTKEFLKDDGKGAFTVNIALIENGFPVFGIVYAPALDRMFWGAQGLGAWENDSEISARQIPASGPVAVASASHRDALTDQWLTKNNIKQTVSIGSSLKFCLLAAGEADVYPRFGPTMEWDTAAGDAILRSCGGSVETPEGEAFAYGKKGFRNQAFVARGKM